MEEVIRHFTVQEAQELVPWLRQTFDAIEPLKDDLTRIKSRVQSVITRVRSNGGDNAGKDMDEATKALLVIQNRMSELSDSIVERGIILRSVDQGLVDFPSIRDKRTVYLCWRTGESSITQWHETDVGFAGRRPL